MMLKMKKTLFLSIFLMDDLSRFPCQARLMKSSSSSGKQKSKTSNQKVSKKQSSNHDHVVTTDPDPQDVLPPPIARANSALPTPSPTVSTTAIPTARNTSCGVNELWTKCAPSNCFEMTCGMIERNIFELPNNCNKMMCKAGCQCVNGYARDYSGDCVPYRVCTGTNTRPPRTTMTPSPTVTSSHYSSYSSSDYSSYSSSNNSSYSSTSTSSATTTTTRNAECTCFTASTLLAFKSDNIDSSDSCKTDSNGIGLWMKEPPENGRSFMNQGRIGYALYAGYVCVNSDMMIQLGNHHEFKACVDLIEARCEELGLLL